MAWIFFCCVCPGAGGEESVGTAPFLRHSFQERWSPGLDLNLRGSYYYKTSDLAARDTDLSGDATLRLSRELTESMIFRIDPRANFDTFHTSGVELFIEDQEQRPAFTLNEVLLAWYGNTAEIEVGKKIYSWKVADGYSPLDTLNPMDMIELMASKKIGVPSVSVLKLFDKMTVQAVWLPFFVPDRQPDETNRWLGDDPEARARFVEKVGVEPVIVDRGRDLPDTAAAKMSIAARISSSSLFTGWDLALIYRYGYNTRGVIRNDINFLTLPQVFQTTEYPSYHLYGVSFSTVSGDVEYHGEAAFHDSVDNWKDEDYISYITGVNYTNHEWLSQWFDQIQFVAEYAGEKITQKRDAGSYYTNQGVARGLTANLITSVRFKMDQDHSFKTAYVYNLDDGDSLWDIFGQSALNDHVELIYGYQNLSGDPTSFFGQWDDNDRVYITMSLKY